MQRVNDVVADRECVADNAALEATELIRYLALRKDVAGIELERETRIGDEVARKQIVPWTDRPVELGYALILIKDFG